MISTFVWYLLSLRGRVSRQEFLLGCVGLLATGVVLARIIDYFVFYGRSGFGSHWDRAELQHALRLPSQVVTLVLLWPAIAILVKRLHDLNVSGWWSAAVVAIPVIALPMSIAPSTILVVALVIVGSLPGAKGINRFGAAPLPRGRI